MNCATIGQHGCAAQLRSCKNSLPYIHNTSSKNWLSPAYIVGQTELFWGLIIIKKNRLHIFFIYFTLAHKILKQEIRRIVYRVAPHWIRFQLFEIFQQKKTPAPHSVLNSEVTSPTPRSENTKHKNKIVRNIHGREKILAGGINLAPKEQKSVYRCLFSRFFVDTFLQKSHEPIKLL